MIRYVVAQNLYQIYINIRFSDMIFFKEAEAKENVRKRNMFISPALEQEYRVFKVDVNMCE